MKIFYICTIILLNYLLIINKGFAKEEASFIPINEFEKKAHIDKEKTSFSKLSGEGARIVDMSGFPATFISVSDIGQCTASVVSENVVLTAAHCVRNGGTIHIDNKSAICEHSPDYNEMSHYGLTADYALCIANGKFNKTPYESVKTDFSGIFPDNYLLLSGAGCTTKNPPTYDSTFRVGFARILANPSQNSNDIVTGWDNVYSDNSQGTALCSGDSGGAAFYLPRFEDFSKRTIVAVNSRSAMFCLRGTNPDGSCIDDYAKIDGKSYLSSLATNHAKKFLQLFAEKHNVEICGFNFSGEVCRK